MLVDKQKIQFLDLIPDHSLITPFVRRPFHPSGNAYVRHTRDSSFAAALKFRLALKFSLNMSRDLSHI